MGPQTPQSGTLLPSDSGVLGLARPSRARGINPCPPGSPVGLPAGLAQTRPRAAWRPSPPSPAQRDSPSARPAGGPTVAVNPAGASDRRGPRAARAASHFLRGAGGAGRALHHSGEAVPGGFPSSFRAMIGIKGGRGAEPRDYATHLGRLMTAHPGPSCGAPWPRPPPGARSARVRAPRRLPHRPAGRGRSPAVSAGLKGPRHQLPGCPDRPSRDSPGLSFLTCKLGLGVGGGGRKRSAALSAPRTEKGPGWGKEFQKKGSPRGPDWRQTQSRTL